MPNKVLWERQLPRNTGFAFEMKRGQSVRVTSQTIIDFVCFNGENLRERFDQARTKANQRKVFISTGDLLVSKLNNTMMTIIEDTFTEGHHDLQEGMCSRKRHELAAQRGIWEKTYGRPLSEIPPHGCTENLANVLAPYQIAVEDDAPQAKKGTNQKQEESDEDEDDDEEESSEEEEASESGCSASGSGSGSGRANRAVASE